jgi:hypothetical protein
MPFVIAFAIVKLLFHITTNGQYGFHRDELATLADARHLDWGFAAYPPLTPFLGRIELALFGESLRGFRFFAALAQCAAIVVAALIAKRLGGGTFAQCTAALAVAIGPVSLAASSLFQYVAFDFLWWVLIAYFLTRVLDDPRWWVAIGITIGLGVETKYTIAFFVAGVVVAVLATPLRAQLRSKWLWIGVAVSIAIAAPNLLWQVHHDFISLDFLRAIHARDVRIGRTSHFLIEQLYVAANLVTVPLWIAGFVWLWRTRFRMLAIAVTITFFIFLLAQGRSYYTAPLFAPLLAAGAVLVERTRLPLRVATIVLLVIGSGAAAFILPLAPIGSHWFETAAKLNGDLREEIGWPDLVYEVARIYNQLPPFEREHTGIFCGNYGEAGAIDLYGPRHGLPSAMSGTNSYWLRGYPTPAPTTVIVLGQSREDVAKSCAEVVLAGQVTNRFNVANEETERHREILLCRGLKMPWSEIWPRTRSFG